MTDDADERHIGPIICPEPNFLFWLRMLNATTNWIHHDALINQGSRDGEWLDKAGAAFGFTRLPLVDHRCGERILK